MRRIKYNRDDIVRECDKASSASEAAKKLNMSLTTFIRYAKQCGCYRFDVHSRKGKRTYYLPKNKRCFNENIFDVIDSNEKAYILGFMAADVCVRNVGQIRFDISYKDVNVLYLFCDLIDLDRRYVKHVIRKTSNVKSGEYDSATLSLCSVHMVDTIKKYGIVEGKSYRNIDFFTNIPDIYKLAWLSGYIDGDGCLSINKTGNICISILSNYSTLASISAFYSRYGITTFLAKRRYKNGITMRLDITRHSDCVLVSMLYLKSCNCQLARKRDSAESIIDTYLEFKSSVGRSKLKVHMPEFLYDVYMHKNVKKKYVKNHIVNTVCPVCGKQMARGAGVCKSCYLLQKHEASIIPDREVLKMLIYDNSFVSIGEMFNVTDNAVRKWCKKYGLPYRSRDIKRISKLDWQNI